MIRSAIIIVLINYCAFLFSQSITYTRNFDTKRKSVPIQIINNQPDYFYVLRYNKPAHDLTIERRVKPSGEVAAFTPLKLDSVNADWFDYERLNYKFFEYKNTAYFVFEKTVNLKKTIYLKVIDTLGRSNGFAELAYLEKETNVSDIRFEFKQNDDGHLLITGSQFYLNKTSKKVVMLYDLEKREKIWLKKLPLENPYTGYSQSYTANTNGDLFYILSKARVDGYKRKYIKSTQVMVPVFFYDSLFVMSFLKNDGALNRSSLAIHGLSGLKSISIAPGEKQITVLANYTQQSNSGEDNPFFLTQGFSNDLSVEPFSTVTLFKTDIKKQLTFYDGTDYKNAADKDHALVQSITAEGYNYFIAGRSEENYYKELLLWKTNLRTGEVISQELIPRKIFYFDDRTRFKNIGVTAQQIYNANFYSFLLEDADNLPIHPHNFNFREFSRQKYLWGANLVAYILRPDGNFEKKLVHKNGGYDFVPLSYSSNQNDFVFYLNEGKLEKFAILKLDGF